jgi:hypothetical protein
MRSIFFRIAKRAASIDWTQELNSNELNMLIIFMIHDLGQAFVSHRTKIFLRCTNSAFIMSLCRALEILRALDEFCLLHPPPLVDLAQPFEVAPFFAEQSPLK